MYFKYCILRGCLYITKDFDKVKAGSSKLTRNQKGMNKSKIFAPASPALSSKVAGPSAHRTTLRATDTGTDII